MFLCESLFSPKHCSLAGINLLLCSESWYTHTANKDLWDTYTCTHTQHKQRQNTQLESTHTFDSPLMYSYFIVFESFLFILL